MTRTLLVLGAGGALGKALLESIRAYPAIRCVGLGHAEADVTERNQVDNAIRKFDAQVVINCAAMTDVDGCERDPMIAAAVNAEGARTVAQACREANVLLVHISTDFVFDGRATRPYREADRPAPMSVYGATKYEGERHVGLVNPKHLIVRTAWTFGLGRDNFVTKVIARARRDRVIRMVRGQTGSPTYTVDLAKGLLALVFSNAHGMFHVVNSGQATRAELARAALDLAGLEDVRVEEGDDAPPPPGGGPVARRPAWSVLDAGAFTARTGVALPHWRDALKEYLSSSGGA